MPWSRVCKLELVPFLEHRQLCCRPPFPLPSGRLRSLSLHGCACAGLVIEFVDPATGGRRTATFLPEVAAHEGWDKQQVGWHGFPSGLDHPAV